ncbi:response regulator [Streptomyces silvisoli]|uniref:Transcriptional regulatory protein n=1 Tax=Streptomyces silvisoli TaxID=3034235 RepID=A0ABT5ZHN7_9ACTN|nr:response regulator [Streptomyces silvisoli]MDF3289332.1 response regulator [Streptomyces silvisoli]
MIRVLVVEDDPVAASAHRMYVERLPGFEVAAVAHSGAQAMRFLDRDAVDLILLDLHLPDGHGLQLIRSLRAAGHTADVIAVTSARDLDVVRQAVSVGVVQYLLKPFTFPALRDRMERWSRFRDGLSGGGKATGQDEVDRALSVLRGSSEAATLPKGLSAPTLDAVTRALRDAGSLSAGQAAAAVGVSRITARRYLEHLVGTGQAVRSPQYGQVGRPELSYRLSP